MNLELLKHMKNIDDEEKSSLAAWLCEGHGHSTCPPKWFIERGIPEDYVNERVSRQWSNFVFVPKECIKISLDAATDRPIGLFKVWGELKWHFLLTPQDTEKGYKQNTIRHSTDTLWIDRDEWEVFFNGLPDEVKKEHSELSTLTKQSYVDDYAVLLEECPAHTSESISGFKHYHMSPDCHWDDEHLVVELYREVTPTLNYDGKEIVYESEDFIPYLTKTVSGRRLEFINMHMVWNYGVHERGRGMDMESIIKKVDDNQKQYKDNKRLISIGGKEIATAEEWRTLSKEELIQKHVDDRKKELEFYSKRIRKWEAEAPGCLNYVMYIIGERGKDVPAPTGWGLEWAQPLGYTDCMWNGRYFVPWVDGTGSSSMISSLCREFDVDESSGMIGRGSHARAIGENLSAFLVKEGILGEEE